MSMGRWSKIWLSLNYKAIVVSQAGRSKIENWKNVIVNSLQHHFREWKRIHYLIKNLTKMTLCSFLQIRQIWFSLCTGNKALQNRYLRIEPCNLYVIYTRETACFHQYENKSSDNSHFDWNLLIVYTTYVQVCKSTYSTYFECSLA